MIRNAFSNKFDQCQIPAQLKLWTFCCGVQVMNILAPITVIDCLNPPFTILMFNSSALKLSLNGPLMPPKNRGNVPGRSTGRYNR